MILVDTSAWTAVFLPSDTHHFEAVRWHHRNRERLLMTDYIVDETLTLLRARGRFPAALQFGDGVFRGRLAEFVRVSDADVQAAWAAFRDYLDKDWSITDCTSRVVMQRLGISHAFAFDDHFRQFATVTVEP